MTVPWLVKILQTVEYPKKYGLMDRLYKEKLTRNGIVWAPLANGFDWKLDMTIAVHRWMVYGVYDSPFINWAKRNVLSDGIIVDSGANIGQSSAYLSKIVNNGLVLAFEPDREACAWLHDCLKRNQLGNVEVIEMGLGEIVKKAFLDVPADGANLNLHGYWSEISESGAGTKIAVTTLAHELNERDISHVSLWKLDVEGYEIPALEGARAFLKKHQIAALYIELATKKMNNQKIISYMKEMGYQLYYLSPNGIARKSDSALNFQSDGLFLPSI